MKFPSSQSIYFKNKRLFYLNQKLLPQKEVWEEVRSLASAIRAIKELRIRGAPLIGVFAAYSLYLAVKDISLKKEFLHQFKKAGEILSRSRPTAVNLFFSLKRMQKVVENNKLPLVKLKNALLKEAKKIHREEVIASQRMAEVGLPLIKKGDRLLTHCNTGFLATAGEGTALGVIYAAKKAYKDIFVYADETRPLLQGGRLTSWELLKKKIKHKVIVDAAAAFIMQKGLVDKILVGADRITSSGDVANKIGTYSLALAAHYHKIPFYVVAPVSSFDFSLRKGEDIEIEMRSEDEVKKVRGKAITHYKVCAYNPAFDITPHKLITAIITDKGLLQPPFERNIQNLLKDENKIFFPANK